MIEIIDGVCFKDGSRWFKLTDISMAGVEAYCAALLMAQTLQGIVDEPKSTPKKKGGK